MLTREEAEEIRARTVKQSWLDFKKSLMANGAGQYQLEAMKDAFFSGAAVAYFQTEIAKEEGKVKGRNRINRLFDEINEHMRNKFATQGNA